MADFINIQKRLGINAAKPLDYNYGPYESVEALKTGIPKALRYKGMTAAVIVSGAAKEYWFKSGVMDINNEKK